MLLISPEPNSFLRAHGAARAKIRRARESAEQLTRGETYGVEEGSEEVRRRQAADQVRGLRGDRGEDRPREAPGGGRLRGTRRCRVGEPRQEGLGGVRGA